MKYIFYIFLLLSFLSSYVNAQVQVNEGWNMIGALTTIQSSEVITDPPGIIISSFYGYNGGYYIALTLEAGNGFWVKVSTSGTIYGFEPLFVCGETPINYEYKFYGTVQIGTQCWLKENLDVGTMIPGVQNQTNLGTIEKYCFDDNPTNCQIYGALYQWDEAMQYVTTPGTQGICPSGWHIPTYDEFQTLGATVGNDANALKAVGQGLGDGAGTNTSGFSGLLTGNRWDDGSFVGLGANNHLWSSTESFSGSTTANDMRLYDNTGSFILSYYYKNYGYSVRCLKD